MVVSPPCKVKSCATASATVPTALAPVSRRAPLQCYTGSDCEPEPYMITSEIYRGADAVYDAEAVYDARRVYGIELSTRRSSSRCSPGSPSV